MALISPGRVGLAAPLLRILQTVNVLSELGLPTPIVALVEGIDLALLRHLQRTQCAEASKALVVQCGCRHMQG